MRRSLGKGLSHLIAEQFESGPLDAAVGTIQPNRRQPRKKFHDESLRELAESVKSHGIIQPLLVKRLPDGNYELIAGERRLRAAKMAGIDRVPILIRESDQRGSLELALIENLQREDIGPVECATAYKQLVSEFGLTQEQVAERVGKSRVAVTNTLRLLNLPRAILDGLGASLISEGHARALMGIEGAPAQLAMYEKILKLGLSVREVESASRLAPRNAQPPRPVEPNWEALQDSVSQRFGAPVTLQRGRGGAGKVVIQFFSDEDLERILAAMGYKA